MIKKYFFVIYLFFICIQSQAALTKLWDFRYGGAFVEVSGKFIETPDHGFLLFGASRSGISFDKTDISRGGDDYWIIRTDSAGNILWDKTYGGINAESLSCAILLPDSGFLIGGSSFSDSSGEKSEFNHNLQGTSNDFWIVRIDKYGNKIWDRTIGGDNFDYMQAAAAFPDGSLLLAGSTQSSMNGDMTHTLYGDADYWVVKLDRNGIKLWDQNYGGIDFDNLLTVNITSDKGFILGGKSYSPAGPGKTQNNINGSSDYWIVKIDSNGTKLWDKTIGGDGGDFLFTVNVLPGDKLLLCGTSTSGIGFDKSSANHGGTIASDYWLVKTDSLGNILWDKVFGGDGWEDEINNISVMNGGFLITGTSYSNISGDKSENNILNTEQPWLLAIDAAGNKIWDKTINAATHIEFCYGSQISDGCFVIMSNVELDGGDVSQLRFSSADYWLAKFCLNGSIPNANYTASSTAFCQNTCLDFTNLSTNAFSYQWFFQGGTPSSSAQADPQGICYDSSGTFDVTLIAFNGAGTDTLTLPQFLTVYPQVPFVPITQIGDTLFSVPGYVTYQWYADTVLIPGAVNYYYIAQHSGDYSVIVTDSNGCFAAAFMTNVIVSASDKSFSNSNINLFSSDGKIIVETENLSALNSKLIITNAFGEIVFKKNFILKNGRNEFSAGELNLSQGIYIASIHNSEWIINKRILIN